MKNTFIKTISTVLQIVLFLNIGGVIHAESILGNGNGTEENPYKIRTQAELEIISDIPDAYYILENDIELSGSLTPLCSLKDEFTGVFDGNGHSITNITISDYYEYSGLFGKNSGTIRNLKVSYSSTGSEYSFWTDTTFGGITGINKGTIENCEVSVFCNLTSTSLPEYSSSIGGVTGKNADTGKISNCAVTGEIAADVISDSNTEQHLYIGGISGINSGKVNLCYTNILINSDVTTDGYIYANFYLGGITGSGNGTISNTSADYTITAGEAEYAYIGGICGYGNTTIENTYANGSITSLAYSQYAGGIAGMGNSIQISNSKAEVTASFFNTIYSLYFGGIVGFSDSGSSIYQTGAIVNFIGEKASYETPNLYCGGLGGYCNGTINNCFAKGDIATDIGTLYIGGLVGSSHSDLNINNSYAAVSGVKYGIVYPCGTVTNSFYDAAVSGCDDTGYGNATSALGMKLEAVYKNANWNFDSIWEISSSVNDGYPYLKTLTTPFKIVISEEYPYAITLISNKNLSGTIAISLYDEENQFKEATLYSAAENIPTSIEKLEPGNSIKVMWWESMLNLKPVCKTAILSVQ